MADFPTLGRDEKDPTKQNFVIQQMAERLPAIEVAALGALQAANNLDDLDDIPTTRTNLGLGAAALQSYAEGTWTPALTFGGGSTGITYGSRNGSYTKIGRQVFIRCYIALSSKGSSTGVAAIEGLPFAGNNTADYYVVGSGGGSTFTLIISVYPIMFAGDSKLRLFSQGTASQTQLADTNFNNTTDLGLGIHYHT